MDKEKKDIFSLYGTDNIQYAEYDKGEAEKIIIPTEANASIPKKQSDLVLSSDKADIIEGFLDFAEGLGEIYIGVFKKLIHLLLPLVLIPYKAFSALISFSGKSLRRLRDKNLRQHLARGKAISRDIRTIRVLTLKQDDENKTAFFIKSLRSYISQNFFQQEQLMSGVVNHLLPFAAILVVIMAFHTSDNRITALKIMYQGTPIAYAENRSVWNEGKNKALSMLYGTAESEDFLKDITFKTERIKPSSLSSAEVISENLLANSSSEYKRACGIYINGELLCAVLNESDALSVLDSILAPYEKNAKTDTIVGFVEEIEYVQGYYPENSDIIWDTAELLNVLQSKD